MITLTNVSKELKGKVVLDNLSFSLNKSDCVLVKGKNGSGKTMLLRILSRLIKPTTGKIEFSDNQAKLGVIIENISFFPNETALYNLRYLASINKTIDDKHILNILKQTNLYDYRNAKVRTFSLGMKHRLAFCQAIMENPDIILLDEPFNAVDEENIIIMGNILSKFCNEGKIVVVASHISNYINLPFNRCITLCDGRMINDQLV